MKLIGNLKKTMEKAQTREEPKDTIMKTGVLLNDDDLIKWLGCYRCETGHLPSRQKIKQVHNATEILEQEPFP